MATHKWRAEFQGEEWGADGETVWPTALADYVREREGTEQVTPYGKPYLLTARDAGAVRDAFYDGFDRSGYSALIFIDMDPVVPEEGVVH
jgi:hypothetical protein